ncbi:MAG: hypothetical protein EOP04_29415 [Proteobacteria bacterium]|nr:MAG: hypothetical protein EOP04_29415 [Pseudomonadota bacterium]
MSALKKQMVQDERPEVKVVPYVAVPLTPEKPLAPLNGAESVAFINSIRFPDQPTDYLKSAMNRFWKSV